MPLRSICKGIGYLYRQSDTFWNRQTSIMNSCKAACRHIEGLTDYDKGHMTVRQIKDKIKGLEKGISSALALITLLDVEIDRFEEDLDDDDSEPTELEYLRNHYEEINDDLERFKENKEELVEMKRTIYRIRKQNKMNRAHENLNLNLFVTFVLWFFGIFFILYITVMTYYFVFSFDNCQQIYENLHKLNINKLSHFSPLQSECITLKMTLDVSYAVIAPILICSFEICLLILKCLGTKYEEYQEMGKKYRKKTNCKSTSQKQIESDSQA